MNHQPATEAMPPLVEELLPAPDAEETFLRLAARPRCIFFDSARRDVKLGRYSFLSADPFDYLELPVDSSDALGELERRVGQWSSATVPGLPPFQGGAAGLLSYDLGRQLERLPAPKSDEFTVPALAWGFYDVMLAFDHQSGRCWLISHGWPELDPARRSQRAKERMRQFHRWLLDPPADRPNFL